MPDTCPNCNKNFTCQATDEECWCMQYPTILPIEEKLKRCFCAACLKEKAQITTQHYVQEVKAGKRINDASKYAKSRTAIEEGIDYYLENGLFVFTEWYHLKRGRCCKNNCRHCPY